MTIPLFFYTGQDFSPAIRFADENHRLMSAEKPGSGCEIINRLLIFPNRFSIAMAITVTVFLKQDPGCTMRFF
jgi:hypothetical protein